MVSAVTSHGLARFTAIVTSARHAAHQRSCHGIRESCTPKERPSCPPCESPPPPACREAAQDSPCAVRKVCCAPPSGLRPPCPPPEPPCALTCDNTSKITNVTVEPRQVVGCGVQLDRVAQRLAAAKQRRREQYEEEARRLSHSQSHLSPIPAEPYNLKGVQHCARATDGHDYICAQTPTPTRTCVNGVPPPPTPVPLKSSKDCEIQRNHHLDPCAHKPRVFVEIDRSATIKSTEKTSAEKASESSTRARKQCKENKKEWCKSPPQLANVPPPCREPSLVERFRRGIGGTDSKPSHRALHTRPDTGSLLAAFVVPCSEKTPQSDKLSAILKETEKYEETGRGRTIGLINNNAKVAKSNFGSLELQIPSEADAVRVSVTLVAQTGGNATARQSTTKCTRRGSSDSWLSIKNIQKKLSSSKKKDPKPSEKETSCPVPPRVIPANPCAPSRSRPPNPPRTPSTADPCAPKDNRTRSICAFYPLHLLS
ncbi:uncharacterized protein LOC123709055 [Pieris brassicae]|uniref:uncharacterized protein LOC123709055 n=1 Tax=Pieris brassicae TaxID=7116 RepID=UPI001E65E408|nr:uncharacterized protein LOC123709055 [Pieris brassicae]